MAITVEAGGWSPASPGAGGGGGGGRGRAGAQTFPVSRAWHSVVIVEADRAFECEMQVIELVRGGHDPPPNEQFGDLVLICMAVSYGVDVAVVETAAARGGTCGGGGGGTCCGRGGGYVRMNAGGGCVRGHLVAARLLVVWACQGWHSYQSSGLGCSCKS